MDWGSVVNELLLQSKGIIMCEPSGRFRVVYLSLLWRCVLPHCPSIAVSLFSSPISSVINISRPPSSIIPPHLKCIRILSQPIYQLIWFLLAICVVWKDRARDAIMVYLFKRLIKNPGCARWLRCNVSPRTHSTIRTDIKKKYHRSSLMVLLLAFSSLLLFIQSHIWITTEQQRVQSP